MELSINLAIGFDENEQRNNKEETTAIETAKESHQRICACIFIQLLFQIIPKVNSVSFVLVNSFTWTGFYLRVEWQEEPEQDDSLFEDLNSSGW